MRRLIALVAMIVLVGLGCFRSNRTTGPPPRPPPMGANMMRASAPTGLNEGFLGRAVDANFNPVPGAAPLFELQAIMRTPVNVMRHELREVASETEFAANAKAWVVFNAGIGYATGQHHAAYRAYQVRYIAQINNQFPMTPPPPGAAYYIAQIEFGHSYEGVVSGDWNRFNARVGLELKKWGGDIKMFANQYGLDFTAAGIGLRPRDGRAIFARDQASIEANYSTEGPPAAIFVSYQPVSALAGPGGPGVPRAQPLNVTIRFDTAAVKKTGSWFSDRWNLSIACGHPNKPGVARQVLQAQKVSAGESIPLNYSETVPAVPGERITCMIQGQALDKGRNLGSTPFEFVVPDGPRGWSITHGGGTGKTEYVLHGVVQVQ